MLDQAISRSEQEAYAEFIQGIELTRIWLDSAEVSNRAGPNEAERYRVQVADVGTEWEYTSDQFTMRQSFYLRVGDPNDVLLAEIRVAFGLMYRSEIELSERFAEIFAEHNLPLNVWPYFREFVASMSARMGWQVLTIPVVKPRNRLRPAPDKANLDQEVPAAASAEGET